MHLTLCECVHIIFSRAGTARRPGPRTNRAHPQEKQPMRNAIARWTPTGDLVRDRFGRLVEDAFNEMLRPFAGDAEATSSRSWIPRVDIRENADGLTLQVDLPGLGKDDVAITLENNVLTIAGERKLVADEKA